MFDFVVIGDVMTDHILQITDPTVIGSIDQSSHTVSFPFPSKVQLEKPPHSGGGGNAFNAAMVLRHLGMNTGIYTVVGKDHEGQRLIASLREKAINVDLIELDNLNPSNSAHIMSVGPDRLIFSHHYPRNYQLPKMPETRYVYLTSLGEDDKPLFNQIIQHKKENNFFLLFSPGTLQVREDFADIKQILEITDLLVVNKREAKELSRLQTESNENLLKGLLKMGPKQVIITRSDHGSIAHDGERIIKAGALKVPSIECTGAGDTYTATVAAALARGKNLETAMQWGAINAASVLSEVGINNMKDEEELEQILQTRIQELKYIEPQPDAPLQPREHQDQS